jgi:hypothetical protein
MAKKPQDPTQQGNRARAASLRNSSGSVTNGTTPGEADQLSLLIGSIYDAALDPALWPSVLEQIAHFVPGTMANLFASDAINRDSSRFFTWGDDPHFTALFLETYSKINPLFPKGLSFPLGEVFGTNDIMPHPALEATRFYKEYMQPQGYVDFLAANLEKAATSVAVFALARHERDGLVDDGARRRMKLIAPHVRRAVLIGQVLDFTKLQSETLVETIDGLASGVLLLDAKGRLVHANASGRTLLESEYPLKLDRDVVVTADESTQRRLRAVFAGLGEGNAAVETGGIAVLARGRNGTHFTIHVLPLVAAAGRSGSRMNEQRRNRRPAGLWPSVLEQCCAFVGGCSANI